MAARIRLGRKGRRIAVVATTTAFMAGLALAPPAQTFGGSCNGHLSSVGFDASHERGPVTIDASAQPAGVVIIGSRGSDTIIGSDFDDFICGGGGNDVIHTGNATNGDAAWGEWGRDTITGGDGDDLIDGGPNDDFIVGNAGEDKLFGGRGDDHINSNDGAIADNVKGGSGYNFCEVDSADDPEDCHF
jgi:hemolysin type calcium-binding protein